MTAEVSVANQISGRICCVTKERKSERERKTIKQREVDRRVARERQVKRRVGASRDRESGKEDPASRAVIMQESRGSVDRHACQGVSVGACERLLPTCADCHDTSEGKLRAKAVCIPGTERVPRGCGCKCSLENAIFLQKWADNLI